MIRCKVGAERRVFLPAEIADLLDVHPGDTLGFRLDGGRVVLRKIDALEEALLRNAEDADAPPDRSGEVPAQGRRVA